MKLLIAAEKQGYFIFDVYGTFVLDYESTTTVEGMETVTVPEGSYETIRFSDTDRMYGCLGGDWYEDSSTGTTWLAKYIGEIKSIDYDQNGREEDVLISTNVKPPVDLSGTAKAFSVVRFSSRRLMQDSRMTESGRLSPLPASSILGIRAALEGRLAPVPGPLESKYQIIS